LSSARATLGAEAASVVSPKTAAVTAAVGREHERQRQPKKKERRGAFEREGIDVRMSWFSGSVGGVTQTRLKRGWPCDLMTMTALV
jgi:hypothetical protein